MAKYCRFCGEPLKANVKFCGKCGGVVEVKTDPPRWGKMPRIGALVLAVVMIVTLLSRCGGGNTEDMAPKEEKKPVKGMKTIYVVANQKTVYESNDLGSYEDSWSLEKNGVVNGHQYFSSYKVDDEWKEFSYEDVYVIDYENIMQYMDTGMENDEKIAKKYRALIDKQKHVTEDDSIEILSIDANNKICRKTGASINISWREICEEGSHFDYSYNEAGQKVEYMGFIKGNLRTRTTYEYNAENKMTLLNMYDYITNRETKYELLYDSENRNSEAYYSVIDLDSGTTVRNHTQYMYNSDGKLEKSIDNETELSIYKYDEAGKLKKTSNYSGDGNLVSVIFYTYEKIIVPAEDVEFLCHLYDTIGIRYEIVD